MCELTRRMMIWLEYRAGNLDLEQVANGLDKSTDEAQRWVDHMDGAYRAYSLV
jgi:hypothetical protein